MLLPFWLLFVPLRDLLAADGAFGSSFSLLGSTTFIGIPIPTPSFVSSIPFSIPCVEYGLAGDENGWWFRGGGCGMKLPPTAGDRVDPLALGRP